jgi:hypothetical protein
MFDSATTPVFSIAGPIATTTVVTTVASATTPPTATVVGIAVQFGTTGPTTVVRATGFTAATIVVVTVVYVTVVVSARAIYTTGENCWHRYWTEQAQWHEHRQHDTVGSELGLLCLQRAHVVLAM